MLDSKIVQLPRPILQLPRTIFPSKMPKKQRRKKKKKRKTISNIKAHIVDAITWFKFVEDANPNFLFVLHLGRFSTFFQRVLFLFSKIEIKRKREREATRWSELERGLERAFDFRLESRGKMCRINRGAKDWRKLRRPAEIDIPWISSCHPSKKSRFRIPQLHLSQRRRGFLFRGYRKMCITRLSRLIPLIFCFRPDFFSHHTIFNSLAQNYKL